MATELSVAEWVDALTGYLRLASWVDSGGNPAALQAALQSCSNAELQYATTAVPFIGGLAPVDASYPSVFDVAVLNFQTVPGGALQVVVPAPLRSMFMADGLTVDPTAAVTAALITAVIGTASDAAGNLATAYISGVKSSRRKDQ